MPVRTCALIFAAAASLGLAGCERGADSGLRGSAERQPFSTGRERSLHHSLQLPA